MRNRKSWLVLLAAITAFAMAGCYGSQETKKEETTKYDVVTIEKDGVKAIAREVIYIDVKTTKDYTDSSGKKHNEKVTQKAVKATIHLDWKALGMAVNDITVVRPDNDSTAKEGHFLLKNGDVWQGTEGYDAFQVLEINEKDQIGIISYEYGTSLQEDDDSEKPIVFVIPVRLLDEKENKQFDILVEIPMEDFPWE